LLEKIERLAATDYEEEKDEDYDEDGQNDSDELITPIQESEV